MSRTARLRAVLRDQPAEESNALGRRRIREYCARAQLLNASVNGENMDVQCHLNAITLGRDSQLR